MCALNVLLTLSLASFAVGEERVCQAGDAGACADQQNFLDEGGDALSLIQTQMSLAREGSALGLGSNVDNLVQTALAMVEEGGGKVTPAVQKFLKGVLADIEKTLPHITDAHGGDQGKLDSLYKKLTDAIAALEAKKKELEKAKAAIGETFGKLSACRKEESGIYGKWQVCLGEQKALQEIHDSKEEATATVLKDFRAKFSSNPSVEAMLKPSFRAAVSSTSDSFKVANKELNVAIKNLNAKIAECEGIAKSLSDKKAACDAIQGTFESDFCAYASDIKSTCSAFDKTYALLSGLFEDEQASVKKLEADRKVEFTGLKQAACILSAIMKSSGKEISFEDIETCKKSTTPTDHLDIKYDDTPLKPPCTPLPPFPCAAAFVAKYYSKMPTGTTAATCKACS
jgi:DNA repair exonuclease SbcCD ATPase subunit